MENKESAGNKEFVTTDLNLAAFLMSEGLKIKKVKRVNALKVSFCFFDREDREELVLKYINKEVRVNLNEYNRCVRDLKLLIHNID